MAVAVAAKHMAWLKGFIFDLMIFNIHFPSKFYVDNTSAIFNATNEAVRSKSKHIDRRYHFICEKVAAGDISIIHVSTSEMLADHLTKPLGPVAFKHAMQINHLDCAGEWGMIEIHDILMTFIPCCSSFSTFR